MINRFFLKKFGFNAVVLLQFVDRGDMAEILLRNVLIIEMPILLQGRFQVASGDERGAFQDLGDATFDLIGISNDIKPQSEATLRVTKSDGSSFDVPVVVRLDTPIEIDYYRAGGILPYVLAQILRANG